MFFLPEDLRVSDADRDAAIDFLNRHYAAGRLTDDELSARIDAAHAARYDSQLEALTGDLPALPPARTARRGAGWRLGPVVGIAAAAFVVLAVASAIPAEDWAVLLGLVVPLILMLLFTVAPIALPLLAFAWIAHALTRPASRQLPRGSGEYRRTYGRWP